MKKFILLFLSLFLLSACSKREDYYVFGFDDYSISVGYDNVEYMKLAFDFEVPDELEANQTIDSIKVYNLNKLIAEISISNDSKKTIESNEAIVTKLIVYLKDLSGKKFSIDGIALDTSIKKNCETFSGTYIEKNGYACLIEKEVANKNNSIIMYGDYLNLDQDVLERIEISYK